MVRVARVFGQALHAGAELRAVGGGGTRGARGGRERVASVTTVARAKVHARTCGGYERRHGAARRQPDGVARRVRTKRPAGGGGEVGARRASRARRRDGRGDQDQVHRGVVPHAAAHARVRPHGAGHSTGRASTGARSRTRQTPEKERGGHREARRLRAMIRTTHMIAYAHTREVIGNTHHKVKA